MKMNESNGIEQLELLSVKESNERRVPAKRVDIVSLRLVKETSLLYIDRAIRSPEDGYNLFKQFLGELDREYFVIMCLVSGTYYVNNACLCTLQLKHYSVNIMWIEGRGPLTKQLVGKLFLYPKYLVLI